MASNSTDSALPNPFTVLAFLPPLLADQFQAAIYVYVACLSVSMHLLLVTTFQTTYAALILQQAFVWEWLASMADEYKILRRGGPTLPIFAYFLSRSVFPISKFRILLKFCFRIGTLGYCLTTTIFQGDCEVDFKAELINTDLVPVTE